MDKVFELKKIPLQIRMTKRTVFRYNMNVFMRIHWRKLAQMVKALNPIIKQGIPENTIQITEPCHILFVYYAPNKIKRDLSNMCAVLDKMVIDTLTKEGVFIDDNVNVIGNVHYHYGGMLKGSHYIDLTVFQPKGK